MTTNGVFYAIPPESDFYHCLERKPSIRLIAKHLHHLGSGIYLVD
jgi:hypothetical protein